MVKLWLRNKENYSLPVHLFQVQNEKHRPVYDKTVKSAVVRFLETGSVDERKRPSRPPSGTSEGSIIGTVANVDVRTKQIIRGRAKFFSQILKKQTLARTQFIECYGNRNSDLFNQSAFAR